MIKSDLAQRLFLAISLFCYPVSGWAQDGVADSVVENRQGRAMTAIDLTHPFDKQTVYWPTENGFDLKVRELGYTDRGYFYAANVFAAAEHGGTHLDAPIHFYEHGQTVEQIPLSRLTGPLAVIDVSEACVRDADYQVGVADLRGWEERHGETLVDKIVLIRTGYAKYWPNRKSYLGTDARGAEGVRQLHFPGLAADAAKWIVEHRSIKAIGIDTASIDYGQSKSFGSHVALFEHGIPAFENVADMELLPEIGAEVVALPMKIAGGSGAPLRIIAFVPELQHR